MKSAAAAAPSSKSAWIADSKRFEIATVAQRDDDAFPRYHYPAAVLALDLLDRAEPRQGRAECNSIDVAVTLPVDVAVAHVANDPVQDHWRSRRRVRLDGGDALRRLRQRCRRHHLRRRNRTGNVRGFAPKTLRERGGDL